MRYHDFDEPARKTSVLYKICQVLFYIAILSIVAIVFINIEGVPCIK